MKTQTEILTEQYARDPQKVCDYLCNPFVSGSLDDSLSPKMHNAGRQMAQALIAGDDAEVIRLMRAIVAMEAAAEATYDVQEAA